MLYRRAGSRHLWCRFTIGGREVRRSTGTSKRREAEAFEQRARSAAWRQIKLGERLTLWETAVERWKLEKAGKRSLAKDEQILSWFGHDERLKGVPIQQIDGHVIDRLRKLLLADGLGRSTVNRYMEILRAMLKACVDWELLDTAPKVPMFRERLTTPPFLTSAQFDELLKHLPEHTRDLARLAVFTGLRRDNITQLEWSRIDLKRRTAFVVGEDAKGGHAIPVPLDARAVEVLTRWEGKHERFVFVYRGKPVYQVATKAWRKAVTAAGLPPGFRFHDLRHTWASWHVMSGTPLEVLQKLGGWRSLAMVQRYAHLAPGHVAGFAGNAARFYEADAAPDNSRHSADGRGEKAA